MLSAGSVFNSKNSGSFEIVEYINYKEVIIRFIDTGYETSVHLSSVRSGSIMDRMRPSLCGVGFIGSGKYASKVNRRPTRSYGVWIGMIRRCYDVDRKKKNESYKDCTVCDEWHNFQNFAKWFEANYIDGFHLDKDIKIKGNRVYSPDACMFVSVQDNADASLSKSYKFKSPEGCIVDVYNLSRFCRDNKLNTGHMCNVHCGKLKQHKGWKAL